MHLSALPDPPEKNDPLIDRCLLINEGSYTGVPFRPHAGLPISEEHFTRWLNLFNGTVDELFKGPVADLAHSNAERMAEMFLMRIERLSEDPSTFIQ